MEGANQQPAQQPATGGQPGDQKLSQHAKRRQQKKLKKEQEQAKNGQPMGAATQTAAATQSVAELPPPEPLEADANQIPESDPVQVRPKTAVTHQTKGINKEKREGRDGTKEKKAYTRKQKKEYFEVSRPNQDGPANNREESFADSSQIYTQSVEQSADVRSDHSMRDESQATSENLKRSLEKLEKYEEAKQGEQKEQKPRSKPKRLQVEQLPLVHVNRKLHTVPSTELGFTGDSKQWFDEDAYKAPKHKANFDEASKHDYYFNSYSSHHIHEEMLKDTHRTTTYRSAIEGNKDQFRDKIVLDIGCGTGILSIFAARAGAKHVYAIDAAEIALFAKEIVKDNGLADKITVFHGKMEELDLPFGEGEVDIIISEWMGYFLLYESMLDCVLWARDKFLNKQTGKMLPDRAKMFVSAIEDSQFMGEKVSFWDNVYDVNMSCMTKGLFKDPIVDTVPSENIMSDSCCILDLDLVTMKKEDVEFSNFYSLNMLYNDNVHAMVFWFDTAFSNLDNPVTLTTSPHSKYTHWKQSVLYLEKPLRVHMGEVVYGSLAVRQDRTNFRELNIKMSFHLEPKRRPDYPEAKQPKAKHIVHQYKFK